VVRLMVWLGRRARHASLWSCGCGSALVASLCVLWLRLAIAASLYGTSAPEPPALFAVLGCVLSVSFRGRLSPWFRNGPLVLIGGRPGNRMWINPDGMGDEWQ
jgi:hypothetical protein